MGTWEAGDSNSKGNFLFPLPNLLWLDTTHYSRFHSNSPQSTVLRLSLQRPRPMEISPSGNVRSTATVDPLPPSSLFCSFSAATDSLPCSRHLLMTDRASYSSSAALLRIIVIPIRAGVLSEKIRSAAVEARAIPRPHPSSLKWRSWIYSAFQSRELIRYGLFPLQSVSDPAGK